MNQSNVVLLLNLFPYWGAGLILVCAELAIFFRRRKSRLWKPFVGLGGFLGLMILFWLIFRGDKQSALWVQRLIDAF
jgi:hypothetical protein